MASPPKIEFYFDCSSPYTYMGFEHIQKIAATHGDLPIIWKPILVGGIFNAINKGLYAERENPAVPQKFTYAMKAIQDWARILGLEIHMPPACGHPVNAVLPMRVCLVMQRRGAVIPYARATFEALWRDERDIGTVPVVTSILEGLGVDPGPVLEEAGTADIKTLLRLNTDEVIERGGFGSPTIFINDHDMHFGNDAMPLIEAAIERQLQPA